MQFRLAATLTMVTLSFDEAGKEYIAARLKGSRYKLRMASGVAILFQDGDGGCRIYPPLKTQKRWTLCWGRRRVVGLGAQMFGVTPVTVANGDDQGLKFRLPRELNEVRTHSVSGAVAQRELDRITLAAALRQQLTETREAILPRLKGQDHKLAEQLFNGLAGLQTWVGHCTPDEVARIEHLCARLDRLAR